MASKKRQIIDYSIAATAETGDFVPTQSQSRGMRRHDLSTFAKRNSPAFTGAPTAPTAAGTDQSDRLATTLFVANAVAAIVNGAPGVLDTIQEVAAALGNDQNFSATILNLLAGKTERSANLSDLQSIAQAKINLALDRVNNTTDSEKPVSAQQLEALNLKAPLASPGFTGTPTAPTAAPGNNSTQLANTAFVVAAIALALAPKANLASPEFSGVPTAPTAAAGTASGQIATTEFVAVAVANLLNSAPGALDTLKELADALGNDANFASTVTNALAGKVDKVAGKQLSTEDYSSGEKAKLAGISVGAQVNPAKATQELAEEGEDDETMMTPLRTKQAIEALGGVGGSGVTIVEQDDESITLGVPDGSIVAEDAESVTISL